MPDITIPAELLPTDGRFGSGPTKVRPEALAALAERATDYMGTSHRQMPVKLVVAEMRNGIAELLRAPTGTRSSAATAAPPASGMRPSSG